jgi:hypothetical protein
MLRASVRRHRSRLVRGGFCRSDRRSRPVRSTPAAWAGRNTFMPRKADLPARSAAAPWFGPARPPSAPYRPCDAGRKQYSSMNLTIRPDHGCRCRAEGRDGGCHGPGIFAGIVHANRVREPPRCAVGREPADDEDPAIRKRYGRREDSRHVHRLPRSPRPGNGTIRGGAAGADSSTLGSVGLLGCPWAVEPPQQQHNDPPQTKAAGSGWGIRMTTPPRGSDATRNANTER